MSTKKRNLAFIIVAMVGLIMLVVGIASTGRGGNLSGSAAQQEERATLCHNSPEYGGYILLDIPLSELDAHLAHGDLLPNPDCNGKTPIPTTAPTDPPPPTPEPAIITIKSACLNSSAQGSKLRQVRFILKNEGASMTTEGRYILTNGSTELLNRTFTLVAGQQAYVTRTSAGGIFTLTVSGVPNAPITQTQEC